MKLSKLSKEDEKNNNPSNTLKENPSFFKIEEQKFEVKKEKNKKNFKFIPNVKICLNVLNLIKGNFLKKKEIFALSYLSDKEFLYSGGLDTNIHIWSVDGSYKDTLEVFNKLV